tara:strand:- start:4250 stop:5158 length:909 start_codon:yes stop_codon:yes gene_type:complete
MNNNNKFNELVSVIYPIYSYNKYINQSLKSVINQSYNNLEILIIDDSDDELISNLIFKISDKRIKYFKGNKSGLSSALNYGIEISNGDYIARMDCDDLSHPSRIEKQIKFLNDNNLDVCGSNVIIIDISDNTIDSFVAPKIKKLIIPYLISFIPFFHGSVLIKKKFIIRNELFYKNCYAEDKQLWIDFFYKNARFGNVDEFLYKYRQHSDSLFLKNKNKLLKELKLINNNFIKKNILTIKNDFLFNLNNYNKFSEKDKEILVDFYIKCFLRTFNFKFLKIFFTAKSRYTIIYIIKYLFKFNT